MTELGLAESGVQKAVWSIEETSDHMLELTAFEVGVRPYETEAMREARRQMEEEKQRRAAESRKDNIGERALHDMMYGALEAKTDSLTSAQALEAPEFMTQLSFDKW